MSEEVKTLISKRQIEEFEVDGYTVIEDVFSAEEMLELAEHIEALQRKHEEAIAVKGGTEGISRAGEITFTPFLAEQCEQIATFCRRQEFVDITTTLLGPDIDLYWNQAVFKGPEGEKQFPWHQDDGYTPVTPSPYLTLWLSLNGATAENGTISVLPGSHRNGLVEHKKTPIGLACHELDDPDQGIVVPVTAGSIAAFQSLTMHKSGINRSTGIRKAYIVQYSKAGLRNALTGELIPDRIAIAREGRAARK